MTELIPIDRTTYENPTIDARELYGFLGTGKHFATWIRSRMREFGFQEGEDFYPILGKNRQRGRPATEYALSIDMAKELCMLERTEIGRKARKYFIEVEKRYRDGFGYLANSGLPPDKQKQAIDFYSAISDTKGAIDMGEVAKVLDVGIGRNTLFGFLREKNILNQRNIPHQRHINAGWFRVILVPRSDSGSSRRIYTKSLVYMKGLVGIFRLLTGEGYTPRHHDYMGDWLIEHGDDFEALPSAMWGLD